VSGFEILGGGLLFALPQIFLADGERHIVLALVPVGWITRRKAATLEGLIETLNDEVLRHNAPNQ